MKSDGWNWSEETAKLLDLSQLKLDAMSAKAGARNALLLEPKNLSYLPCPVGQCHLLNNRI
jgi:hypothetical protein